jgi:methylated-DNA-[protein]-cysteine S-methyltransferase
VLFSRGSYGMSGGMSVTLFQQRVYDVVARIPRGRVATYKDIAARLGCGSPRAVGQALRRNPFAPRVPCHRVISSSLAIGGFQGEVEGVAIRRKVQLLEGEGVRFSEGKLTESSRRFTFEERP